MIKGRALLGVPILDAADGRVLGRVADLVLDPTGQRLEGLVFEASGLLRQRRFLAREQLRSLGPGAVVCAGETGTELGPGYSLVDGLAGRRLYSLGGEELGVLYDLHFDPANHQLTQIEASAGFLEDAWHGKAAYPAGPLQIGDETILLGGP